MAGGTQAPGFCCGWGRPGDTRLSKLAERRRAGPQETHREIASRLAPEPPGDPGGQAKWPQVMEGASLCIASQCFPHCDTCLFVEEPGQTKPATQEAHSPHQDTPEMSGAPEGGASPRSLTQHPGHGFLRQGHRRFSPGLHVTPGWAGGQVSRAVRSTWASAEVQGATNVCWGTAPPPRVRRPQWEAFACRVGQVRDVRAQPPTRKQRGRSPGRPRAGGEPRALRLVRRARGCPKDMATALPRTGQRPRPQNLRASES